MVNSSSILRVWNEIRHRQRQPDMQCYGAAIANNLDLDPKTVFRVLQFLENEMGIIEKERMGRRKRIRIALQ